MENGIESNKTTTARNENVDNLQEIEAFQELLFPIRKKPFSFLDSVEEIAKTLIRALLQVKM